MTGPTGTTRADASARPHPAERFGERIGRARSARPPKRGSTPCSSGSGPDLEYLTGYRAMPLERLTMLVVPAAGPVDPGRPAARGDTGPRLPGGGGGFVEVAAWEETDDAIALVAATSWPRPLGRSGRVDRPARASATACGRCTSCACSTGPVGAPRERRGRSSRELRMIKDADEIELLRLAAEAADRVVAQIAAGPLVGRTEADVAREVRERLAGRGPRPRRVLDRRLRPEQRVAPPRGLGPGDPGRRADRPRHRRGARRLRQRHHPDDLGHRRRPRARARRGVPPPVRRPAGGPGPGDRGGPPGIACEAIDATARRVIDAEGYGEQFIHRTGHGIGLEGHEEPYLVAGNREPLRPGWRSASSPGSTSRAATGRASRTSWCAVPTGPIVLNRAPLDLLVVDGV